MKPNGTIITTIFQNKRVLFSGLLIGFAVVTLGPGFLTRHGQTITCSSSAVGCSTAINDPFGSPPNDDRVAGNAGDLIAIYCQYPYRNINVYGIDQQRGVYLASFGVDKVVAAGLHGLTTDLGAKGVLSITTIAPNTFYVVDKGGLIATFGMSNYAKVFTCNF